VPADHCPKPRAAGPAPTTQVLQIQTLRIPQDKTDELRAQLPAIPQRIAHEQASRPAYSINPRNRESGDAPHVSDLIQCWYFGHSRPLSQHRTPHGRVTCELALRAEPAAWQPIVAYQKVHRMSGAGGAPFVRCHGLEWQAWRRLVRALLDLLDREWSDALGLVVERVPDCCCR
jgi:hypothetical protein